MPQTAVACELSLERQHHLYNPVKYMYESPGLNGIAYSCICFCSEALAARQRFQAANKAVDYHTLIPRVNWQIFHFFAVNVPAMTAATAFNVGHVRKDLKF